MEVSILDKINSAFVLDTNALRLGYRIRKWYIADRIKMCVILNRKC